MLPCHLFEILPLSNFEKYMKGTVTAIFILLGLILNIFALLILQKLINRSMIHRYLQGLALWDNILLISGFFVHCLPVLIYGNIVLMGNFVYTYRYTYTIGNISLAGTVWMTVILAADRYVAIVHPFNAFTRDRNDRSVKVCLLICGVSFMTVILGIPYAFEIQTGCCLTANNTTTVPAVGTSELRQNWYYQVFYRIISAMFLYSFAPMLLLIFLLLQISVTIYRAKQQRKKLSAHIKIHKASSENGQAGNKILKLRGNPKKQRSNPSTDNEMMIFVAVKFLLTRSLTAGINIAELALSDFKSSSFVYRIIDIRDHP